MISPKMSHFFREYEQRLKEKKPVIQRPIVLNEPDIKRGRIKKSFCGRGHYLEDISNIRVDSRGVRRCKKCSRIHSRTARSKK